MFEYPAKLRLCSELHGSIRVQEGQPSIPMDNLRAADRAKIIKSQMPRFAH